MEMHVTIHVRINVKRQKNTSEDVKDKVVIVIVNTLIFKTRMLSTIKYQIHRFHLVFILLVLYIFIFIFIFIILISLFYLY